jgi:hypothetical protein
MPFDFAEGCGLCSSNKPLEQLKQHFPDIYETLANDLDSLENRVTELFKDHYNPSNDDAILFFRAFDPFKLLPLIPHPMKPSPKPTPSKSDSKTNPRVTSPKKNKNGTQNKPLTDPQNPKDNPNDINNDPQNPGVSKEVPSTLTEEEQVEIDKYERFIKSIDESNLDPQKYLGYKVVPNKSTTRDILEILYLLVDRYCDDMNSVVPTEWSRELTININRSLLDVLPFTNKVLHSENNMNAELVQQRYARIVSKILRLRGYFCYLSLYVDIMNTIHEHTLYGYAQYMDSHLIYDINTNLNPNLNLILNPLCQP